MANVEELMSRMPPKVLYAYNIWRNNHSNTKTAKLLGVHRSTIWEWRRKYQWDLIEDLRTRELIKGEKDTIEELRRQQRAIVRAAINVAIAQLKGGKLTVRSASDLVQLLRYQRELEGDVAQTSGDVNVNVTLSLAELHEELMKRRMELNVRAGEDEGSPSEADG